MKKSFFAPAPLLPPTLSVGFKEYVEYVEAYKVYVDFLAGSRASWKKTVKERASKVKEASSRSCDLKVTYDAGVREVKRSLPSGSVKVPTLVPVVEYTEVPRIPQNIQPLSDDEKRARIKAKRQRHRRNVALRKAEYEAKLTTVKAKVSKNQAKIKNYSKIAAASKTTGKAGNGKPAAGSGRKSRTGKDTSDRLSGLKDIIIPNPSKLSIPEENMVESPDMWTAPPTRRK